LLLLDPQCLIFGALLPIVLLSASFAWLDPRGASFLAFEA